MGFNSGFKGLNRGSYPTSSSSSAIIWCFKQRWHCLETGVYVFWTLVIYSNTTASPKMCTIPSVAPESQVENHWLDYIASELVWKIWLWNSNRMILKRKAEVIGEKHLSA